MNKMTIAICLLLAGCASPTNESFQADTPVFADPAEPAVEQTLQLEDCIELSADFLFPTEDYAPFLPEGYTLDTRDGQAVVNAVLRQCGEDTHHIVGVLVVPPADQALDGSHAIVLETVWATGGLAEVLPLHGVPTSPQSITIDDYALAVTSGWLAYNEGQDWWFHFTRTGDVDDAFATMRYFQPGQDMRIVSAFDISRGPAAPYGGPATAHHLPFVGSGNAPFNQQGDGRAILQPETLTVTLA